MRTTKFFISILTVAALTVTSTFSVSADNAAEYGNYDSSFTAQPATERVVPSADPDFEEMTLEKFKTRYPAYKGIKDPRSSNSISPYAVTPDPGYVTSKYSGPFVWKQVGSKWYLYASNGATKVSTGGWYQENNYWYFLYPTGAKKYDGTTAAGEMTVGWEKIGNYWYYFSSAGIMQTDWTYISSGYYYFRRANEGSYPMGSMLVGAFYLNSEPGSSTKDRNYYFDANGRMQDWTYPVAPKNTGGYFVSLSSCFNDPRSGSGGNHQGIDIEGYKGYNVLSATSGTIYWAQEDASMVFSIKQTTNVKGHTGNMLILRYMHMQEGSLAVIKKQTVSAGQKLGLVGSTGDSTGPHLHFDINYKRKYSRSSAIW